MESLSASHRGETLLNPKMDPSLWSMLPKDILLSIFDALPVNDHYRLRSVCKHWHNRASERHRLPTQDQLRVREPFFLLLPKSHCEMSPFGTLALHAASGEWMWRPSQVIQGYRYLCRPIGHLWEAFEVEGVFFNGGLYMSKPGDPLYYATNNGPTDVLFDAHRNNDNYLFGGTRRIPHVDVAPGSLLGMMVDDVSRAYTLILGSCTTDTLVLDSRTNEWESKPSRLVRARPPSISAAPKSCVQLEGKMYLWMDSDEIHVYCPSSDKWSALAAPPRDASDDDEFRGLGHWAGMLYAVTKNKQGTLSVWELNMADKQWSEYMQIPGSLFAHLMQPGTVLPIVASHCNGYFLMHVLAHPDAESPRRPTRLRTANLATIRLSEFLKQRRSRWPKLVKLGRRFVLFNIANRRWEMVDMPYSKLWNHFRN